MRSASRPARRVPADSGQILIMTALMLPVLLGFMAIALDAGYAFDFRKRVQTAADSAALAGGYEVEYEPTIPMDRLTAIVRADATRNGFTDGVAGTSVQVYRATPRPPTTADGFEFNYNTDTTAVGVIITQPKNLFFIQVLNNSFATMSFWAKAVANKGPDSNLNMVVLDPSAAGSVEVQGSSNIQLSGTMHVNSCSGGAGCGPQDAINVVGGCCSINAGGGTYVAGTSSGNVSPVTEGVPPIADPFAHLQPPPVPATAGNCNTTTRICTPGLYNGTASTPAIRLTSGAWTFQPGIYYLNGGGITIEGTGTTATGNGVMIYNGGTASTYGPMDVTNHAVATFTAPTSGTYRAIVYYQDRNNTEGMLVRVHGELGLFGVIYMPSGHLQFGPGDGGTTPNLHAVFVVRTIDLHGGPLIADNNLSMFGPSIVQRVSLAE